MKLTSKTYAHQNERFQQKRKNWQNNACRGLFEFEPTMWQRDFLRVIESNKITFSDSVAGVGKTTTALYYACKDYLLDASRQIVFVRTPVELGGDHIGFLPGDATMEDKLGVHFESTKILIEGFIGKEKFRADLILKLLLERIGENTKTICLGSSGQIYASSKGRNAMRDALSRFFYPDYGKKYEDIGFYKFPIESCQRDSVVMDVIRAYDDN